MFIPEEEVDYSPFDEEQERITALAEEFASTRVEEWNELNSNIHFALFIEIRNIHFIIVPYTSFIFSSR